MNNKLDIIKSNAKHFDNLYIKPRYTDINCDSETLIIDYLIMKAYTDPLIDILILNEVDSNLLSYSLVPIDPFEDIKNYMKSTINLVDKKITFFEEYSNEMTVSFNSGKNIIRIAGSDFPFPSKVFDLIYLRDNVEDLLDYKDIVKTLRENGRIITNNPIV